MKRILLINFGRMGDILQTSPLVTYLKEQNPEVEIGCLAASGFEEVMRGIPGIDILHPLDLSRYMLPLKEGAISTNLNLFKNLIAELSEYNYDLKYNLTHNRLGAVLSWLLPGETVGMTLDREGIARVENPWMRQFYNTNLNRGLNQFNLVDLYKLAAGFKPQHSTPDNSRLKFEVDPEARAWADRILEEKGWAKDKPLIGFQVGASAPAKAWNPESFRITAESLVNDFIPVFFGTAKEKLLVEGVSRNIPGAINLAGETNIARLAAVLQKCRALVSNDTGTMHLAAAVGLPVVALTLGPALASETGPFGEGNIIVEPDIECGPCSYRLPCLDYKCHRYIKPELVEKIVRILCQGENLQSIPTELTDRVRIYKTSFDRFGLWEMRPIGRESPTQSEQVNIAYRKTWLDLLKTNNINEIDRSPISGKDIASTDNELIGAVASLIALAHTGKDTAAELSELASAEPLDLNLIKKLGAELAEIDGQISSLGENQQCLRPLTLDFNLGKEALPKGELAELAILTRRLYKRLEIGAALFKKHMQQSAQIEISSPVIRTAKPAEKILAVNTPYFAAGEIIRAIERRGIDFRLVELDPQIKYRPGGAEEFIGGLIKATEEYKPDFIFTINHLGFDSDGFLLRELEKRGIPSAIYYVDSPLLIMDRPEAMVSDLSTIFCWDEYYIARLIKAGFEKVHYLPLSADNHLFYPRQKDKIPSEFQPEIAFVANSLNKAIGDHFAPLEEAMKSSAVSQQIEALKKRNGKVFPEILEQAAESFQFRDSEQRRRFLAGWMMKTYQTERLKTLSALTDSGLTIFGDDEWRGMFNGKTPHLRGIVSYTDHLPQIYSGAQIGFNMTSYQMPLGLNQRVFDIPAAGGFLLTDYKPALEEIFRLGEEIVVYKSPQEALELAKYFLNHPAERERMSLRAYNKIIKAHTYDHRLDTILKVMKASFSNIKTKNESEVKNHHPEMEDSSKSLVIEYAPELQNLLDSFPQKLDVPSELSTHHLGEKSLLIAPQRAAWIVTDKIGEIIVRKLSEGASMGEAAACSAKTNSVSAEKALMKLREVIEAMNSASFRDNFDLDYEDIDKNKRSLQLFLTRKCNLHCRHCYFSAGKPMEKELTTEEWKAVIRKFAYMGQGNVVTLTGGEPLLHPGVFEIAEEAVNHGLQVVLLSNGQAIKDSAIADRIADLCDSVQISIDGASAPIQDAIRGKGSFDKAVNAVRLLLKAKAEVEITTVVLPENVDDLVQNLKSFIESFASSRLKFAMAVANPVGRLKEGYRQDEESLVGKIIDACGEVPWLRVGAFKSGCINFGCQLARSIVINPEGGIGNCPYQNYSGPKNIRENDFSTLVREDREWHRNAMKASDKCKTCDLRNFACGGCRIFAECSEQIKLRSYYRMLKGK